MSLDPDLFARAIKVAGQGANYTSGADNLGVDLDLFKRAISHAHGAPLSNESGVDVGLFNRAGRNALQSNPELAASVPNSAPPAWRVDPADSVGEFIDRYAPLQAIMTKYYDPDKQAWWEKGINATIGALATAGQSAVGAFLDRPQTESMTDMMMAARTGGALNANPVVNAAIKYNPAQVLFDPVTFVDPDKAWYRRIPESIIGAPVIAMKRAINGWTPEDINRHLDYSAFVAGGVGDYLLDPLTYVTFGAGPLFLEASKLMKATPLTGSAKPLAQLGMESKTLRHAARLTPELEPKAAAMLVQQRIQGSLPKMADTPGNVQATVNDVLHSAYGDGADAFEALLTTARGSKTLPKQAGVVPPSIFDETADPAKRLQDLAEHQVIIERTLAAQRPAIRLMGVQPGIPWTNLKLGSPFSAASKFGSKAVGPWEQVRDLSLPLKEVIPDLDAIPVQSSVDTLRTENLIGPRLITAQTKTKPPRPFTMHTMQGQFPTTTAPPVAKSLGSLLNEGLEHIFEPITGQKIPDTLAVGDIPRLIETAQMGRKTAEGLTRFGIITEYIPLKSFLIRDLKGFAPQDRARMFDYWYAAYRTTEETLKRNPKAVTNTTLEQVTKAREYMDKLRNEPKFWKGLTDSQVNTRPVEMLRQDMFNLGNDFNDKVLKTRTAWDNAVAANDAAGAASALYQLKNNANDIGLRDVFKFFETWDAFNQARTPFKVARANRQAMVDMDLTARTYADTSNDFLNSVRKTVTTSPQMSEIDFLMQTIGTKGDMWNELKKAITDRKAGTLIDSPANVPAFQIDALAFQWKKQIADRVAKGTVDGAKATSAMAFIDDLAKTPEAMAKLAFFLRSMKSQAEHSSLVGRLMDEITTPYSLFMGKAKEASQKVQAQDFARLHEDWGKLQAIHDPNKFGKAWLKFAKQIDGLQANVFKAAGFSPDIVSVLQRNENAPQVASDRATSDVQELIASKIEPAIAKVAGKKSLELPRQSLKDVFRGYVLVKHNLAGLTSQYDSAPKTAWVNAQAKKNVDEGYRLLESVFGDRAKADQAIAEISAAVRPHFDESFERARKAGIKIQYREDYTPLHLDAKPHDLAKFKKALEDYELQGAVSKGKDAPIVSDFLGPAQVRTSDSMAELEWKIEQARAHAEKSRDTFTVNVMDDLGKVLAHNRYLNERALLGKRVIAELQTVMPEHTLFLKHAAEKDKNALLASGWKDIGDLVPGMNDYMVREKVYDLFKAFAPHFEDAAEGLPWFFGHVSGIMRWMKKVNTTFDLMHLKNIAELALIPEMPLLDFFDTLRGMIKNRPKVSGVGTTQERAVTPLSAIADGIEKDPFYKLAEENALFSFKGHESMLPPHERIAAWMEPQRAQDWFRLQKIWSGVKNGTGPFDVIQFDIADRAAKLTLFKKYIKMGFTPHQAAETTNRWMVDYSLRWMNPTMKKWGYVLDPFFAWHFNNIMMHVPNAAVNPKNYALFDHFRRYVTEHTLGVDPYAAHYPEFLTEYAMATEMENPRTGQRDWVFPDPPWNAPIQVIEDVFGDPAKTMRDPAMAGKRIVRFAANRMQPTFSALLALNSAKENKVPFSLSRAWSGDEHNQGMYRDLLWGPQPALRWLGALITPEDWEKLPEITKREFINQFVRMQSTLPSPAQGLKQDPRS